MKTPIENKQIAIVGGGPSGLTLARLLQVKGANVTVFERDSNRTARVQGGTLDLHEESGLLALKTAGLMDAFKTNYRPGAEKLRVTDKHATILLDEHAPNREGTLSVGHFRPEIDRGPLRNMLLDSLQPETVIWDSHFKTMTPNGEGWKLEFHNGTVATADIVIGAEGANSRLRGFVTPIKAFYSGIMVLEGSVYDSAINVPNIHNLLQDGKIFALNDSKTLIVSSKEDGSLYFGLSWWDDENWGTTNILDLKNIAQVLEWFKQEYVGWDAVWCELLEHASFLLPRPQYCVPFDQTWEALPNLTLIGDSAHVIPPFAGEGVNMAMLDSLELSICLTNPEFADVQSAIAAYEQPMRQRMSVVAELTMEQTKSMHAENGLNDLLNMFSLPTEADDAEPVVKDDTNAVPANGTPREMIEGLLGARTQNAKFQKRVNAAFQFEISGMNGGSWVVDFRPDTAGVRFGQEKTSCNVFMADTVLVALLNKTLNPQTAWTNGKLKIKGNMGLAMKLGDVFE
jgi:2-polyprenyl-6-methoxyphenol hydroxylase-like FAD-dependent oxidoreductase